VFLLKGNKQIGFSFEALATCINSIPANSHIQARIEKVLKEDATLPSSPHYLQEGQMVLWPTSQVALYRAPAASQDKPNTSNSKGILLAFQDMLPDI